MSRSLNKVMLIGNVGNDPDVRTTSSGTPIANMSLATTRKWKDGSGEQREKTEWHRLAVWGKLVDVVERFEMVMLGSPGAGGQGGGGRGGGFQGDSSPAADPPPISETDDDLPF